MSVKSDVLKHLEIHRGIFFSGEELAKQLEVSRAAIWKAMKQLEAEGYQIKAIPNKGYCLSLHTDVISSEGIRANLKEEYRDLYIQVIKETGSTNQDAKAAAAKGAGQGSLFVAEKQTAGKGRRGRSFLSSEGNGIYMSIVLKPNLDASSALYITTAASVAVHRAIKLVTSKCTKIKWVNDIYYQDKKVCGILTEAITDMQTGMIDSVILGIGINFNVDENSFPSEIREVAGALYHGEEIEITRNQLIGEIVNQLLQLCMQLEGENFMREYKENSFILGEEILILDVNGTKEARAIDIDELGGLIVVDSSGEVNVIRSGEVTIRKK